MLIFAHISAPLVTKVVRANALANQALIRKKVAIPHFE